MKTIPLTPSILRRIINEEKEKISKEIKSEAKSKKQRKPKGTAASAELEKVARGARVVDANEMAHTIAKEVDHYKGLECEAARLVKKLSEINEKKQEIRSKILERL